jgi:hypothetical protein
MRFMFDYLVAGAGSLIWHWGTGIGLIVICLACAFGTTLVAMIPVIGLPIANALRPLRWGFIIAAALVALFLAGMYVGSQDAKNQCVARQVVVEKHVDTVVKSTKTLKASKAKDPYEDPEN